MKRHPAFPLLTASALALVVLLASRPAQALSLSVGDMNASEWAAINVSHAGPSTLTLSTPASGGNPGSFWQLDWATPITAANTPFGDRRANIFLGASYNPATEGALGTLTVAFDLNRLASTFTNGSAGFVSAAVEQAGRVFIQASGSVQAFSNSWVNTSFSSANASDWVEFGSNANPDFSATGSSLRFGYRFSLNSECPANATGGCRATSSSVGVDNFQVTALARTPVATVPEPQSWALVLVALALMKCARSPDGLSRTSVAPRV